ncbi:MAG: SAM-dependent methyltransferase [Piscirickettsiaceae bacterium]|nr:MAG: SAM-dependent methyltransferase [Piscirickettsiaceae bacterium]PCI71089.1 MAG: SAM-dependent methyltransferase [Piscirickettsiaceae bacterium]
MSSVTSERKNNPKNTRTVLLNTGTAELKREEIREYLHNTFQLEEQLYEVLKNDDAFYLRAESLRHPLVFYYGHTSTFFINKLMLASLVNQRINPRFESIFAVGVDEMSWDDLNESNYDWPSIDEVREYRKSVLELIDSLITSLPLDLPVTWESPFWPILMGIEHQRIHIETSSAIIRQMPLQHVQHHPTWNVCPHIGDAPTNQLLDVKSGQVILGKDKNHSTYGWDNEYGEKTADVESFSASKYLVSNGEFLSFIKDNGYQEKKYWTDEGWNWVQYKKPEHPLFWVKKEDHYVLRTLLEEQAMPWNWPAEVNYLEAKAFCNWLSDKTGKSIRLPSEEQWHHLHQLHDIPDQPEWDKAPGNINLEHWASACPVNHFAFGEFHDLIGNAWQWTETPISGFDGFEVHPLYDDFSTPTFDTRHNIIKGGSWISTGNEATKHARYAFRRHFYQHAGFRYVESNQPLEKPIAMYETDTAVSQYCHFHYGPSYFDVEDLSAHCARLCMEKLQNKPTVRALDLGCAVGRASFELAQDFDHVTGIDFSARFIRIAHQMQQKGNIHYELIEEGEIVSFHEQTLEQLKLGQNKENIEFFQGDATNLKPQFADYDLVLAINLIDRLRTPAVFLDDIRHRINVGGLLAIASPYTWLEEFTPKENWLGGIRKDGEPFSTLDGLKEHLGQHFKLVNEPTDVPFVIRDTSRKFQHSFSQLTIWERIS